LRTYKCTPNSWYCPAQAARLAYKITRIWVVPDYNITLNPKLAALFAHGWTALEWKQRQELRGKHLALWLQGYYASHAAPVPVKVETLRAWSGSRTKSLRAFRQNLRAALDQLKKFGVITAWGSTTLNRGE
jgi:hypothetical protein